MPIPRVPPGPAQLEGPASKVVTQSQPYQDGRTDLQGWLNEDTRVACSAYTLHTAYLRYLSCPSRNLEGRPVEPAPRVERDNSLPFLSPRAHPPVHMGHPIGCPLSQHEHGGFLGWMDGRGLVVCKGGGGQHQIASAQQQHAFGRPRSPGAFRGPAAPSIHVPHASYLSY